MTPRSFPYTKPAQMQGLRNGLPLVPIRLARGTHAVKVEGLVDSGSTLNVLPYSMGLRVGLKWSEQTFALPSLVGNLRGLPAYAVVLQGTIEPFPSVELVFAWTSSDEVPLLLGQTNFFSQFRVFFFGDQARFEISPAPSS